MIDQHQQSPQQALLTAIKADPSLSAEECKHIEQMISQPDFITKLMYGAFGASLAYIVAKYLKLSRTAQILLAVAGFGIGRLLLDAAGQHKDKFVQYDNKIKMYEINDSGNQKQVRGRPPEVRELPPRSGSGVKTFAP